MSEKPGGFHENIRTHNNEVQQAMSSVTEACNALDKTMLMLKQLPTEYPAFFGFLERSLKEAENARNELRSCVTQAGMTLYSNRLFSAPDMTEIQKGNTRPIFDELHKAASAIEDCLFVFRDVICDEVMCGRLSKLAKDIRNAASVLNR